MIHSIVCFMVAYVPSVDLNTFLDLDECLSLLYFAVYLGLRNVHAGILHKFTISMLWGLLSLNEELITMYEEHTALEVWNPSLRLFEKIIVQNIWL